MVAPTVLLRTGRQKGLREMAIPGRKRKALSARGPLGPNTRTSKKRLDQYGVTKTRRRTKRLGYSQNVFGSGTLK